MRTLAKRGFSSRQIAKMLTVEGVVSKHGIPQWNKTTIGRVLGGQGPLRVASPSPEHAQVAGIAGAARPRITPAPYGYRAEIYKLVPDRAQQRAIRRMRHMRTAGATFWQVAERLSADGVPAPRGPRWRPDTVRNILAGRGVVRARYQARHG